MAASVESLKAAGNAAFVEGKYKVAIEHFTAALELDPTNAIVLSNRAFAQLKVENYGLAIADATAAIEADASYLKGYYRRGSAYLALQKYKLAKADFRAVLRAKPGEKDAQVKCDECDKAIRRKAFEEAIAIEATLPITDRLKVDTLVVDASYEGPMLPDIPADGAAACAEECAANPTAVNAHGVSLQFVTELMAHFKAQKGLHKKFACQLLIRLSKVLGALPSLVPVTVPSDGSIINVCGDTHGQYYDTLNIFEKAGLPSPTNLYVFNGDFVDRGSFSVENVLLLFAFKLLYPDHVHLTRGNHETRNMNVMYGFDGEVKHKFDATVMELFSYVFCQLPLALTINSKVFVTHGGLFQNDDVKLDDIAKIPRFHEPPESGLMSDLLWSDPQVFAGRGPSKRGVGQSFGPDVTAKFLATNGLELVIRSHEVMEEGYQVMHGGKLITVFSAPNYCDQMGNKGGIVRMDATCKPSFITFDAVPHPPVKPMAYSSGMSSMFGL